VDPVRDLVRDDPWLESLERSRARRQQSRRSSTRRRRLRRRLVRALATGLAGLGALVVAVVGGAGALGGAARHPARVMQASASSAPQVGGPLSSTSTRTAGGRRSAGVRRPGSSCKPGTAAGGYVNPLAAAHVTGERVDQGVDYAGTGKLAAIGPGRITYVGRSATGWPGAFIEYRLSSGPAAGCLVYYAEGIHPAHGLRVGQTIRGAQAIATIIPGWPTGIEIGWGAGTSTQTYAAKNRQWSARSDADSKATAAGKSFSDLIVALGGPGGRVEG
jgi:hypothetical protein